MKRILFSLICVALCLACLMLPAFAADESGTITATAPDVSEKEYTTPLAEVLYDLFGAYTPRTQTVTVYAADGTATTYSEVIPGLAGLDWNWLLCAALFLVTMYCVLRMIGGLFKWS